MKQRNGFVSNSSSSSFVLIGTKVDVEKIDPKNLKESESYVAIAHDGFEYGTGIFNLNTEMIDYIKLALNSEDDEYEVKKDFILDEMTFIKSSYLNFEAYGKEFKIPEGNYHIWSSKCDIYTPSSLSELEEFFEYM